MHTAWMDLHSAQPEQLYAYAQLCVLQNNDHKAIQSEWEEKNAMEKIVSVNVSKTLSYCLRKLQEEDMPLSLDCYLQV